MRRPRQVWKLLAITETEKTPNTHLANPFKYTLSYRQWIQPETNKATTKIKLLAIYRNLIQRGG